MGHGIDDGGFARGRCHYFGFRAGEQLEVTGGHYCHARHHQEFALLEAFGLGSHGIVSRQERS